MENVILESAKRMLEQLQDSLAALNEAGMVKRVSLTDNSIELDDNLFDYLYPKPKFAEVSYTKTRREAYELVNGFKLLRDTLVDIPQVEVEDELAE